MKKDERGGHDVSFELGLRVSERLAEPAIVESMGAKLADQTFVVFLRAFAGPNGKPRYYAHFSAGSKDIIIAAVEDATAR